MRSLRTWQHSRAAILSVVGHGALFALLALITPAEAPVSEPGPFITAFIVPAERAAPRPAPAAPSADLVERATEPAPPPPAPLGPPPLEPEPATAEPPPAAAPSTTPLPPSPEPAEPAETPPAAVVEAVETPSAETPPTELPSPEPASAPAVASAAEQDRAPGRVLEPHEDQALRRRLASWTGKLDTDAEMLRWRDDGREYAAVLRRLPATDAMGMEQLAVEVTTERDGERLVTELRMTRLAFSNFGQFVNRWDPDVGLHDDVIDGRFHSNTALNIHRDGGRSPVFGGKVTIADRDVVNSEGVGRMSRRAMFPAGIETHVRRIALPERAGTAASSAMESQSQRLEHDSALTFYADGSVGWRALDADAAELRRELGAEPFYLVAAEDVALHVQGTVNGKVLVYSPDRIVISGDLHYASDPRDPNADDYLGLVSERTVEIAEPEVTGNGDLEVYASIYARQRFVVREFRARRSGTLVIHGSLTAGTLSASEPRYATRVEFDRRLTTMRAPGFPLSDRYELDSASGEWRTVPASVTP